MRKATSFIYKSYKFEPKKKKIIFKYEVEFKDSKSIEFTDTVILPKTQGLTIAENEKFDVLLNSLHLILGISYYKLFIPPKIRLANPLNKEQADFFNAVYRKGLGEFCYKNKIDPKRIAKFPYVEKCAPIKQADFQLSAVAPPPPSPLYKRGEKLHSIPPSEKKGEKKILLGIAGGKDSIVAGELLKSQGENITGFIVDTHNNMQIPDKVAEIMGVAMLKIRHKLDEKIFRSNVVAQNFEPLPDTYKGHIPFSAVVGFLGILTAHLYDYSHVAVANEYSANFGNIKYKGAEINHQWSKTTEFEIMMQNYTHKYINPNITYFSVIRPFYEIRVVEMFSKYKKYFPYFTSCNENFKKTSLLPLPKMRGDIPSPLRGCLPAQAGLEPAPSTSSGQALSDSRMGMGLWCGKCPKCAFAFTMLSAFIPKKDLLAIFNKNLFDDENLLPVFRDLLGFGKLKPFDCVGTFDEMQMAFSMASKNYKETIAMKKFLSSQLELPHLIQKVFNTQPAPALPEQFKFSGLKNALILGYGKEGKSVHKYLKNKYPNVKISIADQKNDPAYLKKQNDFDIIVKSPGIPKKSITRPYTTPTNLFFSEIEKFNITTIGVTGSKGKSTTTSLIYEILKKAGKNIELLGNIGNPMIEALSKPIKKNTIFVIELSSYQLDDIKFSPDIAVVLNLFPDHMPYHNGVDNYYEAKKNIINFQDENGIFIYNEKNKLLRKWAKNTKGGSLPFSKKNNLRIKTQLLGEHNIENIKAVITVAKLFNIPDKVIETTIKKFKPLPHRLEFVGEFKGIKFYNDSISTAPESAIVAIQALSKEIKISALILGGEDRGYDFINLEKTLKKYGIKNIVLFPDTGKRILKSKKDRAGLNILETSSMKEAVGFAYLNSPKNSICLLSPASPSHNIWNNFEERGEEYRKWVEKLSNKLFY